MLTHQEKLCGRAALSAALERSDTVTLAAAVAIARKELPACADELDGMAVSKLLRGIGWNRDHAQPHKGSIVYRRNGA